MNVFFYSVWGKNFVDIFLKYSLNCLNENLKLIPKKNNYLNQKLKFGPEK